MTTPNNSEPSFWTRNRDSIITGTGTSTFVALVFLFVPAVPDLLGVVIPILKESRLLQLLLAGAFGLLPSAVPYALGARSARSAPALGGTPAPLQITGSGNSVPSGPPAPSAKSWPEFDRSDLIADCRILVIDDASPDKIAMFERRGFQIVLKQSVEHDAENIYQNDYDLLLLDLRGVGSEFGASKGNEALPLLRRDNPWLPIVIFTSFQQDLKGQALAEVEALSEGVLRKSLRYDEIETRVIEVLQRSRSRGSFESLLRKFDVANVDELLDAALHGALSSDQIRFTSTTISAPHREAARRVIQVAVRVLAAARRRVDSRAVGGNRG